MSNSLPNAEPRDYNSSAVLAVYDILRRQPWKTVVIRIWNAVRRLLLSTLIAASLATSFATLLPTVVEAKSYQVLSSYVPFKFQIGDRTFKPGRYDFIMAGPGIVAMRDEHERFVASITTKSRTAGGVAISPKLVFNTIQRPHSLSRYGPQKENRAWMLWEKRRPCAQHSPRLP